MTKRNDDLPKFIMLAALAIGAGYLVIQLARVAINLMIPTADAQTAPRVELPAQLGLSDRANWIMPVNEGHPLCWVDSNTSNNLTLRIFRYRVEGGPRQLYIELPKALWVAQPQANKYCTAGTHKVPKAGHWVYEAQLCYVPVAADGSNCSAAVTGGCASGSGSNCAGVVQGAPRGWWVYAYLPAPTGPVVD